MTPEQIAQAQPLIAEHDELEALRRSIATMRGDCFRFRITATPRNPNRSLAEHTFEDEASIDALLDAVNDCLLAQREPLTDRLRELGVELPPEPVRKVTS